jgi:phage terminase small subunit
MTAKNKRPPAPNSLPKPARELWDRIAADYAPDHFSAANLAILEQLCRASAFATECDRQIAKHGLVLDGKANPLIQPRGQAWCEVRHCATKLRLAISGTLRRDHKAARPDPTAKLEKPWDE